MRRLFFAALAVLCGPAVFRSPLAAEEPVWTKVLSGNIGSPPSVYEDRVFVTTSDRMITSLSSDGSFLWSRPLSGKDPSSLCVTREGIVIASSSPGFLTAWNANGSFLWQLRGAEIPVVPPRQGRDGRIFLVFPKRIACVTVTGGVKWAVPLDERATGIVSETRDGDLLVATSDTAIVRISPFGEVLERIAAKAAVRSMNPASGGFVAELADGTVLCFDVRNGRSGTGTPDSESVWEYRASSSVTGFCAGKSALLMIDEKGKLVAVNATDGSPLWSRDTALRGSEATIIEDYGQYNVSTRTGVVAVDGSGKLLWQHETPESLYIPVTADSGLAYIGCADWVLRCLRMEDRIKSEKTTQKRPFYGILNGTSTFYGMPSVPSDAGSSVFFDEVSADIADGTTGPREVNYARRLSEILRDDSFDASERARAALLLGKLGSDEYRTVLVSEAKKTRDPSLGAGILLGLGALGTDPDGTVIEAVEAVVRNCGNQDLALQRAACDALYALVRYSTGKTARDGVSFLSGFLDQGGSNSVNEYARMTLEKLLR